MSLSRDLGYALRVAWRRKGLTIAVVLMISVGISANVAIFAIVHGVLIDRLAYGDPERLVLMWETDLHNDLARGGVSMPDFRDWEAETRSFESMSAVTSRTASLTGGGSAPERATRAMVSERFFSTLGVTPIFGRDLTDEEIASGQSDLAIISHGLWQRRYGGSDDAIGSDLVVDGVRHTVVGVLGEGQGFPIVADVWTPIVLDEKLRSRGVHGMLAIGRLKDDVTVAQANDELVALMTELETRHPDDNAGRGAFVEPIHEAFVGDSRTQLRLLFGASMALLLVVCANVAGLMLARSSERAPELAVRQSLGASRSRLFGQLVVESLVLGLAGGAIALVLAPMLLDVLKSIAPDTLPRMDNVSINPAVFAFAAAAAILTGAVAGIVPAMQMTLRGRLNEVLSGARGAIGSSRRSLRQALVIGQVAVAVVLVVSAGLLARTLDKLSSVDPGIRAEGVVTLDATLPDSRYQPPAFGAGYPDWPQAFAFYDATIERLRAVPGVTSVALALNHPLRPGWTSRTTVEGRPDINVLDESRIRPVSAAYFATLGMSIQAGRGIRETDRIGQEPVVVVNHTFAEKYFRGESAIGQRISFWSTPRTIVGVVRDSRFQGLEREPEPAVYPSLYQVPMSEVTFVVRGSVVPESLVGPAQEAIWSVDPELALYRVEAVETTLSRSLAPQRFRASLMIFFGGVALALASIGVYGLLAWQVSRRTREIGVRMALGAEPGGVMAMVLREGTTLTAAGVVLGLVAAIPVSRLVSGLLFGIPPMDAPTYVVSAFALMVCALLACAIPARRAAALDPVTALRDE